MRILGGASALLLLLLLPQSDAVLPTAQLDVLPSQGQPYSLYTSQASFGPFPPMSASNNPSRIVILPPENNSLLCDNITNGVSGSSSSSTKTIMLVARGECTFEVKAQNAQLLGADAVLISGTLSSRYSVNKTKHGDEKYPSYDLTDILYPKALFDYDCQKGRAEVPAPDIRFKPLPYNADHNDPILTGDTDDNLCKLYSPTQLRDCPSKSCLLTGNYGKNDDESKLEVCCAWDLHVWLYRDTTINTTITIPASYLTMEQGLQLLNDVQTGNVQAILSSRHRPDYNFSSLLIWALGVFVAALAAYLSAGDYHYKIKQVLHRAQVRASSDSSSGSNEPRRSRQEQTTPLPMQEETLELTPMHALGFIIMASAGLFILFFFKIYSFVKVMYAFGCSNAVVQVITLPVVRKIAKRLLFRDFTVWKTGTVDFGDISYLEIIAFILGYGLGFSWLYVAFFVRHPGEYLFFWVMQDVMGACMCITFLSIIKLNSIKVAVVLLTAAFLYDIFMVFVTPYIFAGKSVMIIVATSGGPPTADPSWCEKYPDDADCQGGDPLPMLLTMPRIGDYMGGSSLLGLGDIVLPGLLLSFAARMDAAKSLVGVVGGGSGALNSHSCPERKYCWNCCFCSGGYFPPLIIAYAIGLMMANTAVYLMQMGQPALLYLVPCTLGTMAFMGWRRHELRGLWEGPRIIGTADEIVYGGRLPLPESASNPGIEPIEGAESNQQEEEDDGEEAGDVPLLSTKTTLSP